MENFKDLQKAILKISIRLFKLSKLLSMADKLSPEDKESIEKEYKELSQTLERLKAEYMKNAKRDNDQKEPNTFKKVEKNEFEEIRDELIKARLRLISLEHILSKDNLSEEEREKKEREYEQAYSRLRRLESLYSEKAEYLDKVKENYESLKFSDPEQALKVLEPLFKQAKIDFEKVHEEIVALVGGGDYKELLADALLDGIFFTFGHTEAKRRLRNKIRLIILEARLHSEEKGLDKKIEEIIMNKAVRKRQTL